MDPIDLLSLLSQLSRETNESRNCSLVSYPFFNACQTQRPP